MDYNELFSREYTPAHATVPESAESVLKLMGARNGHFDIEKFKATGAAAACAEMMENTIVVNGKVYGQFKLDQVGELLDYYKSLENTTV